MGKCLVVFAPVTALWLARSPAISHRGNPHILYVAMPAAGTPRAGAADGSELNPFATIQAAADGLAETYDASGTRTGRLP